MVKASVSWFFMTVLHKHLACTAHAPAFDVESLVDNTIEYVRTTTGVDGRKARGRTSCPVPCMGPPSDV